MKKTNLTQSAFARTKGVTRQAVAKWISKGLPVARGGGIDPVAADAWLQQFTRAEKDGGENLAEVILRKEKALATLRELEAAKESGKLILISDAVAEWEKAISAARSKLLAIPNALAPELAKETNPEVCATIIKKAVYEALTELSSP